MRQKTHSHTALVKRETQKIACNRVRRYYLDIREDEGFTENVQPGPSALDNPNNVHSIIIENSNDVMFANKTQTTRFKNQFKV